MAAERGSAGAMGRRRMSKPTPKIYPVSSVARRADLSDSTILRAIAAGRVLPSYSDPAGRFYFTAAALEAALAELTKGKDDAADSGETAAAAGD